MKSIVVTTIQFFCIGWILATNPWLAPHFLLILVQFLGGFLGFWAILNMLKSKLNIAPDVRRGASLITTGPYKFLRHPMYTSLILMLLPLAAGNQDTSNVVVFTVLMVNLLIKLHYEERLLRNHFPSYDKEMKGRWRLFPGIY